MSTTTKYPKPVYAVAGAGDLAYRQLRKLPAVTADLADDMRELRTELPNRVADLRAGLDSAARAAGRRDELPGRVAGLRDELPARMARLRTEIPAFVAELRSEVPAAMNTIVAGAAQVYAGLVARGEKVVNGRPTGSRSQVSTTRKRTPAKATKATKATKASGRSAATTTRSTAATSSAKATKTAAKRTRSTAAK
jgi:heparin binding hemagglutinin HbhA